MNVGFMFTEKQWKNHDSAAPPLFSRIPLDRTVINTVQHPAEIHRGMLFLCAACDFFKNVWYNQREHIFRKCTERLKQTIFFLSTDERKVPMKVLLKGGTLLDGTGAKPFVGDVLMEDDRIVKVGQVDETAEQVIDCTGKMIAPGFIDAHSHNDMFYDYDNAFDYFKPFLEQGITTQVTGNCSYSPFGADPDSPNAKFVGSGLFAARKPGSFAEFKQRAKGRLYVNMAPLVGHGTARISVNGMSADPLTPEQIREEIALVDEAMREGAIGGSFGFMYEPSQYAKEDELVAFASKVAEYDGIMTVHPRAESKVAMDYSLLQLRPHIELGLEEVIRLMEKSKCRMEYSHMIFVGKSSWPSLEPMLKKLHDYRDKGYDIGYDAYSMTYGASVITVICPAWYTALSPEERKKPFNRLKLTVMINVIKRILGIDFCDLRIAYLNDDPKYRAYEGRDVAEIARTEGRKPMDVYLDMVDASNGRGGIYLGQYLNDDIIRRIMEDDLSVFITDAWLQPKGLQNGATYQGFPKFLVKAQEWGIPIEKVVRKMTGATADRFRLTDRGYLKPGFKADITVFSPDRLAIFPEDPARKAEGIDKVFVNGVMVVSRGQAVPVTCGELILRNDDYKPVC